jgi:hypothetical protein
MRYILAMLLLCGIVLAPALASVSVTVHDARYQLAAPGAPADPLLDWARGVAFVTDAGSAPRTMSGAPAQAYARMQALAAARARLAAGLGTLKLTSFATLDEAFTTKLLAEPDMTALCAQIRPVVESYDSITRVCTITCVLPLGGGASLHEVAAKMLAIQQDPKRKDTRPVYTDKAMTLRKIAPAVQMTSGPYTGLVLDCRGLHYTPVITPKLIGQKGNEVWGTAGMNLSLVKEKGVVLYLPNLKVALLNGRVGNTPMIIRPIGTAGPLRGDLVLSADDIAALETQHAATTFLSTLAIVILID